MRRRIILSLLALVFVWTASAGAQTLTGTIAGKVTDESGGVLPGVTVTLSGPAVMGTQTAISNERGLYRFPAVNNGTYTLKFELAGFAPLVREGIVVPVRQTITVDANGRISIPLIGPVQAAGHTALPVQRRLIKFLREWDWLG